MKRLRVYVDTSVIGGCFDREFAAWSKGLMKDFRFGTFRPVLSETVAVEVGRAPGHVREQYDELLALDHDFVGVNDEALELLRAYMDHGVLGSKHRNDMLHIGLATAAGADLLVSWNFTHIVRYDKIRMFNAVNLELGYKELDIHSPREVTHYEEE